MKVKDVNLKIDEKLFEILESILMVLIVISAIKKGGFYITDMNIVSTLIIAISFIYFLLKFKIKKVRLDISHIFLALLSVCYILPLVFGKSVKEDAAIWETIKYVVLFCIYLVITNSSNKKKYEYLLIILGVIIGIFGIDGLADKVLQKMLYLVFNSGYLTSYLDRLSGFIQYANTTAILLMVSLLFTLKYLNIAVKKVQENYVLANVKIFKFLFVISSFLFMCILLTQSRLPIILTVIGIIFILIVNKENRIINISITFIISILAVICSSVVMEYIYINKSYIYLIFAIYMLFNIIITHLVFSYIVMNVKFWYIIDKIKNKKGKIITVSISGVVVLLLIDFIPKDLIVSENQNNLSIQREIKIKNFCESQQMDIIVEELIKDSKYKIDIYEQKANNIEKLVASFSKEGNKDGKFNILLKPEDGSKNYIVKFNVEQGKIKIQKFKLNNKNVILSYLLLPSETIFRFKSELIGSVSTNVRIEYIKDSFKILKTSPIIGRGGEAFRYLYKIVQTQQYNSTEVHSSFIQILIESGILGFTCISIFIIINLKKSKFNENKIIYILFILHCCFDLNFSYLISVIFFAIISSNFNEEKNKKLLK